MDSQKQLTQMCQNCQIPTTLVEDSSTGDLDCGLMLESREEKRQSSDEVFQNPRQCQNCESSSRFALRDDAGNAVCEDLPGIKGSRGLLFAVNPCLQRPWCRQRYREILRKTRSAGP
eukprot:7964159-Pyramimonas_sp.AAC.1